jgi:hypothetical protein
MKEPDPIFAAIEAVKTAEAEHDRLDEKMARALVPVETHREWDLESHRQTVLPAELALLATVPTTRKGLRAKANYFAPTLPAGENGKGPVILSVSDVAKAYGETSDELVIATLIRDATLLGR